MMTINEVRKVSKESSDIKRNEAFSSLVKTLDEAIWAAAQKGKYFIKREYFLNYFETLELTLILKYYSNQGYKTKVQKTPPRPNTDCEQIALITIDWSED